MKYTERLEIRLSEGDLEHLRVIASEFNGNMSQAVRWAILFSKESDRVTKAHLADQETINAAYRHIAELTATYDKATATYKAMNGLLTRPLDGYRN